jgi:glycosidase
VLKEVLSVMRFWLDMGVDGLRLDAVPYLVEREGTNNENLPETHDILKQIRAELDASIPIACCWRRPTSGRRIRRIISATATNATWRSTSR